ncbi:MAG: hypothetical protein U1E56_01315 [Bauldia sp.]
MAEGAPTPPGSGRWVTIALVAVLGAAGIVAIIALTTPRSTILTGETLTYIGAWVALTLLAFAPRLSRGNRGLRWLGIACIAVGAPAVLIGGCVVDPRTQGGQFVWFAGVVAVLAVGSYLVRRADRG